MNRTEKWLALILTLTVFIYVVLRAIFVPTFHDEAATFFHYIVPGNFVPFKAHWDANNHFLNSALAYYCYKLFGTDLIWIRLPNALSFLVYAAYGCLIARDLRNHLLKWLLFIALLTAAFPLEFFAQARGYGMSLAFLLGATYHGAKYLKSKQIVQHLLMWFWIILAVAASLALINSYLILLGLAALSLLQSKSSQIIPNAIILFVLGGSVLAAASFYGFALREKGLLYTGFDDGFLEVTIKSLNEFQFGSDAIWLQWLVAIVGGASSIYVMANFLLSGLQWTAAKLVAALLVLNVIGSLLLNALFGMNFPENRVGLYYIPLFLITVATALDGLSESQPNLRILGFCFLFFPIHLAANFGFDTTLLWGKWHVSKSFYQKAAEIQESEQRPLTISADYLNELGWSFYNFQNLAQLQPMQRIPVPDTLADLIIARPADFDIGSIGYDTVFHDKANDVYLLQKTKQINWQSDSTIHPRINSIVGSDEFHELFNNAVSDWPVRSGVYSLKATVTSHDGLLDAHLVMVSYNENGEKETYDYIPFHWLRPNWINNELHIRRTFSFPPEAKSFKMYFWNVNHRNVDVQIEEFTLYVAE